MLARFDYLFGCVFLISLLFWFPIDFAILNCIYRIVLF